MRSSCVETRAHKLITLVAESKWRTKQRLWLSKSEQLSCNREFLGTFFIRRLDTSYRLAKCCRRQHLFGCSVISDWRHLVSSSLLRLRRQLLFCVRKRSFVAPRRPTRTRPLDQVSVGVSGGEATTCAKATRTSIKLDCRRRLSTGLFVC